MTQQPGTHDSSPTLAAVGGPDEIDIDLGVEVGFIIATTCCSLELEDDDELVDDAMIDEDIQVEAGEPANR